MDHRKKRRSIDEPGHAHFFTFSCYRQWPLLNRVRSRSWLLAAIDSAATRFEWEIWAYVVMPEHVHLLAWPKLDEYSSSRFLAAIKRPVSVTARDYLVKTGQSDWLERLTVSRGGRTTFRFWQAGTGYDRNVVEEHGVVEVMDYIHLNPCRRGLVERPEDWRWSSARFYLKNESVDVMITKPRF